MGPEITDPHQLSLQLAELEQQLAALRSSITNSRVPALEETVKKQAAMIEALQSQVSSLKSAPKPPSPEQTIQRAMDVIFSIGSLMIRYDSTDPSSLPGLSGTRWERLTGRFLYAGSTPGSTGGSTTTYGTALGIADLPPHSHVFHGDRMTGEAWVEGDGGSISPGYGGNANGVFKAGRAGGCRARCTGGSSNALVFDAIPSGTVGETGSGRAHSHGFMPPYTEVAVWRRIA